MNEASDDSDAICQSTDQTKQAGKPLWGPFSSHAYGTNAVYIPEFSNPEAYEINVVLKQVFPEFKTHPIWDYWQGYSE